MIRRAVVATFRNIDNENIMYKRVITYTSDTKADVVHKVCKKDFYLSDEESAISKEAIKTLEIYGNYLLLNNKEELYTVKGITREDVKGELEYLGFRNVRFKCTPIYNDYICYVNK